MAKRGRAGASAPPRGGVTARTGSAPVEPGRGAARTGTHVPRERGIVLALLVALCALSLLAIGPTLRGPFVSDDFIYLPGNPYVQSLTPEHLAAIVSPRSPLPALVENWAPLHLLLHGLGWAAFGPETLGHHVVNGLLHGLAAALLFAAWRRLQLAPALAASGAVLFAVHPANVEAVAWISQLKSPASLVLALAALLLHPARPLAALLCFAGALLVKPTIVFAWPLAALLRVLETPAAGGEAARPARRGEWRWLAGWGVALALFAVAEMSAFTATAGHLAPLHPDPIVRARTIVSLAGRYAWMAATGLGTSTFHEPAPATSWLDPFWLAGLALVGLGSARTLGAASIARRLFAGTGATPLAARERWRLREALGWIWALAAFAPVSQLFPFQYPFADRYLYVILPGLLTVVLCALAPLVEAAPTGARERARRTWPTRALAAGAVLLAIVFTGEARERAAVWSSPERVMVDAALHYPDGISAHQLRARRAAQQGDRNAVLQALRAMQARGEVRYDALLADPAYASLRDDPAFRAIVAEMAAFWIERTSRRAEPDQIERLTRARAHAARGELDAAIADLERAQEAPGPMRDVAARELASLRARRAAQTPAASSP